jgi:DNA-binding winged helix-turn-helix (wHTH) protein
MLIPGSTSSLTADDCETMGPLAGVVRRGRVRSAPIDARSWLSPSSQCLATFIAFGRFRLYVSQRLLLEEGRPVSLGGHALELLIALVERPGEVVSKQDLVARTWPGLTVEESNLRVQISALRRTLRDGESGERYISTVNGRGYCFVAPVMHGYETDQNVAMRDVQPIAISPRMPSSNHELCDSTAAGLAGCSLFAVVIDAGLSISFKEMLVEYQQQISAVGFALFLIPGANPSVQKQEPTVIHKA